MRFVALACIALGVLTAVPRVAAQGSVFRSRTDLAVISVSVKDQQGQTVAGLTPDRFEIREDDAPRAVAALATGDEPLSLVIAVDASESMAGPRFDYARQAVSAFFAARRPDDDYHVLGFNNRVFPVAPGSQSIDVIQRAFDLVKPVGVTALYDAILESINKLRISANPRRAVVVVSDGRDYLPMNDPAHFVAQTPFERFSRTLERVLRSEAQVYAIGINAPLPKKVPPTPDKEFDANALRQMTEPTGGQTIVVRTDAAVPGAATAIVDDLRQQYVLGFEPARPDDGKFHRVTVRVRACDGCRVRTQRGYVATRPTR